MKKADRYQSYGRGRVGGCFLFNLNSLKNTINSQGYIEERGLNFVFSYIGYEYKSKYICACLFIYAYKYIHITIYSYRYHKTISSLMVPRKGR